jgi:small subunit ribosomal protein S8
MIVTDPISDMLNRIRNAAMARHEHTVVPTSKMKLAIARILKEEGFIKDYEVLRDKPHRTIKVYLKYENRRPFIAGMERVSKPGLRVYMGKGEIPRIRGGAGVAIVSTSKGLKTGQQAWRLGMGGELLCYIW